MSLIFIGYMLYTSKQQAEYQQYLETVQTEELAAQANKESVEQSAEASAENDAEAALEREKSI